ncbi:MAG: fibronectin type III domain-containing protein [Verrucomicrobiae bacterium]
MPKSLLSRLMIAGALTMIAFNVSAQATKPQNGRGHRGQGATNYFNIAVPAHSYDLILARPEKNSVTLSALAYQTMEGFVAYGMQPNACSNRTTVQQFKAGEPVEFVITPLQADTKYYYQFHSRLAGATQFTMSPEYSFQTARPPGSSFTFTMTADVHLDEHTSARVYEQSLTDIRADKPDFHIDLGNLFMTDKHATRDEAARQYLAQRFYLGQIGSSAPLFLALGVHDGESSRNDDGSPDSLAAWANALRKKYFPNPVPDGFYSGNSIPKSPSGLLENYFAWTWGDALFVLLDPYRYSLLAHGNASDGWAWSLGREQYDWLAKTLTGSPAKYKFIFLHNLLAGDQASRGGVEIAGFNEWGGKNLDGSEGFAQHRPGWPMPVHQLLLKNHVTAVFRAHDNFYARQELDGVLYLMVPQPSFAGNDRIRDLENYGYKQGIFRGNSGHVRVTVSPEKVVVDYVKSTLDREIADTVTR